MIGYKKLIVIPFLDGSQAVFSPSRGTRWQMESGTWMLESEEMPTLENAVGIYAVFDRKDGQLKYYPGSLSEIFLSGTIAFPDSTTPRGARAQRARVLNFLEAPGADLRRAVLRRADLRRADLSGAVLRRAVLREADLRGADLRGADLGGADLGGADLGGADLRGADLRGADLPIQYE